MEDILNDISEVQEDKKTPLYMTKGIGYSTTSQIKFDRDHPIQMVPYDEIPELLSTGRFKIATREEVKEFYQI